MVEVVPITDSEFRLARQGALSAAKSARGLVKTDDLIQEAALWMLTHMEKVTQWREEGRHGQNKLRHACKQWCLTVVSKERRKVSFNDSHYYTIPLVLDLLPSIWDVDDWSAGQAVPSSETMRGQSRPAEGNNRLAMICDIRAAFHGLPRKDQALLLLLHKDGGAAYEQVAVMLEVSERTVRRREERAAEKIVERLGGEPPWM